MCCPLVFEFSVGIGGFVIGTGSDLLLFLCKSKKEISLSEVFA